MENTTLIERAIESAKCRIYRVRANVGKSMEHQIKADNQAEIQQVTIDALEKQIPKKPYDVNEKENDDFYYLGFICPSCNEAAVYQPYRPKFCKHCGQKIEWSEEE